MSDDNDAQADLLRKFQAAISGMELADLNRLAGTLTAVGGRAALRSVRPDLRRPPLERLAIFRIRVDLDHAQPPIWRRLDLRSDLPLDVVHQVLQAAFDWTDSHLHRFSVGGRPFDRTSQIFLCPYDAEEGEFDDEGGMVATVVRLDETLQEPGDVLHYLYDYGDNWELTLRLEEVLPAAPDSPAASAVAGRRAAPPEDSGGGTDVASIAMVLDDPAHFDLEALNHALRSPYFTLRESGLDQRAVELVNQLRDTPVGDDLAERLAALAAASTAPATDENLAALVAYRWFLDRAKDDGIPLTSAGYLKPDDVMAASALVPAMGDWIGKHNREVQSAPLLAFRESLQTMGLLRKYKGRLLLTRVGAAAQRDPGKLWTHLAERLVPVKADEFDTVASLLLLACAATSPGAPLPLEHLATALSELGWQHRDGRPLEPYELYRLDVRTTLVNVSDRPVTFRDRDRVSPAAAALARTALTSSRDWSMT